MAEINRKPFLELLLKSAAKFGFRRFVLLTGYLGEIIQQYFRNGSHWDLSIEYSQELQPLGTAGAIRNAKNLITSDPFIVLNGDSWAKADLTEFLSFHCRHKADISILLVKVGDVQRYGTVNVTPEGRIIAFSEKGQSLREGWVNAGVYLISKPLIERIPSKQFFSLETDFLTYLNKDLKFFGMPLTCEFIDIGVPETYEQLRKGYQNFFDETLFQ
jgi:NDP-sugar pyrophosphorylase family protein